MKEIIIDMVDFRCLSNGSPEITLESFLLYMFLT